MQVCYFYLFKVWILGSFVRYSALLKSLLSKICHLGYIVVAP
jgi:hypothetical protein